MFFAWSGLGGGLGLLTLSAHLPAVLSRPAKILGLVCLAAGFICFKAAG